MKILMVVIFCGVAHAADWTYEGNAGVEFWKNRAGTNCGQTRQSPIDIPWDLTYENYSAFDMQGYENTRAYGLILKNTGHTAQIDIPEAHWGKTNVSGGGLNGTYSAIQLHFHWGKSDEEGSEHTFRDHKFPLELHIVHFKQSYGSLTEALKYGDGLAVLGFFFTTEGAADNPKLAPLISALNNVSFKDKNTSIAIDFSDLMPTEKSEFYRYMGSLTTPECNEVVVWTVFENVYTISSAQLEKFRELYEYKETETRQHIEWNYRPTQSLSGRKVYKNFAADLPPSYHWSYEGHEGAQNWKNYYQTCSGTQQSPVNIPVVSQLAPYDASLKLDTLTFTNYDQQITGNIINNGHTIQIDLSNTKFYLENGGLPGRYVAKQFHFHWGPDDHHGSEHTAEGKAYPLELHIVHYKEDYGDITTALTKSDGLAVVGFFYEVQPTDNTKYKPIIDALENVKYKGSSAAITGFSILDITKMDLKINATSGIHLPFYRYKGGLTTPPCLEIVTWTVMKNPIMISSAQIAKFREVSHLTSGPITTHDHIMENYRPVQSLVTRKVHGSYDFRSITGGTNGLLPNIISMATILVLYMLLR